MPEPIALYDIVCDLPTKTWSYNTGKIRAILNYKGIPHKTVWADFPDIASICKKIGAAPSGVRPDGSDEYTFPVIHDPSTGKTISDSIRIAIYLEETYPQKPIFPNNTLPLQAALAQTYMESNPGLPLLAYPEVIRVLHPASQEYVRRTREAKFGIKVEEFSPRGSQKRKDLWAAYMAALTKVDKWLSLSKGQYVLGDEPAYVDFHIGTLIAWLEPLFGSDSEEWKALSTANGGRWGKLAKNIGVYGTVHE